MSEAGGRGPVARYYTADDQMITRRVKGQPDETINLARLSESVLAMLRVEGYVAMRTRGVEHVEIASSTGFPDRTPPASAREPGAWIQAIAGVRAKDIVRARRAGGEKLIPAEIDGIGVAALTWARGLTDEQIAALKKSRVVKTAHAEITGEAGSLDDLLTAAAPAPPAPAPDEALTEAAD